MDSALGIAHTYFPDRFVRMDSALDIARTYFPDRIVDRGFALDIVHTSAAVHTWVAADIENLRLVGYLSCKCFELP